MGRGNPRAVTGTHTIPVGDELMVHVVGTAETHLLSPTTASVWQRCDGRASRADLEAVFAAQPAELRPELVQLALDQLEKAGLVEDGGDSSDLQRESRRRFLRKAIVGAAIVPTVMTVTMQPAAAAHSLGTPGCTTTGCTGGLVCNTLTGHCEPCSATNPCPTGYCGADSRCAAKKGAGSTCLVNEECTSNLCEGTPGSKTCRYAVAETCSTSTLCPTATPCCRTNAGSTVCGPTPTSGASSCKS